MKHSFSMYFSPGSRYTDDRPALKFKRPSGSTALNSWPSTHTSHPPSWFSGKKRNVEMNEENYFTASLNESKPKQKPDKAQTVSERGHFFDLDFILTFVVGSAVLAWLLLICSSLRCSCSFSSSFFCSAKTFSWAIFCWRSFLSFSFLQNAK